MGLFYTFVAVKKLFKYILNSTLAILVLLMSIGVSYSTISCPNTENPKTCCAVEQITCCSLEITDNCCYQKILEIQFDFDVPVEKEQESPNFLLAYTKTFYQLVAGLKQIQKLAWVYDLPPAKSMAQQLSILQVYRL